MFCLAVAAAIGLFLAPPVIANGTLTVTSWGGAYTKGQERIFIQPFEQAIGSKVLEDEWDG